MLALRHESGRLLLDARAPDPAPGAGEALVRVTRAALAPEDAAALLAGRCASRTPGREFVGVIERFGPPLDARPPDGRALSAGTRVVAAPWGSCGTCERCRSGLALHCPSASLLGVSGPDGALAELIVVNTRQLWPAPKEIDDDHAVFAAAAAVGSRVAGVIAASAPRFVSIIGDRAEALIAAQLLARTHASTRVLGVRESRFLLCERWRLKHRPLEEAGLRQDQAVVAEFTGSPEGLVAAIGLTRPRGRILLCPPEPEGPARTSASPLLAPALRDAVAREIELVGVRGGSISEGCDALSRVEVLPLITRRHRSGDGPAILSSALEPGALRVLIEM